MGEVRNPPLMHSSRPYIQVSTTSFRALRSLRVCLLSLWSFLPSPRTSLDVARYSD